MGVFILKLDTPSGPRYLDYSTVIDAPITYGVTLRKFKTYYRKEHGLAGMKELETRLARVEEKGTSSLIHDSIADVIEHNRAGKDGTRLTLEQFTDFYAVRCGKGLEPVGTKR
jgi:hypothetical protein